MINDINNLELVDDDYIEYKIILIGDSSVGKTCLFKKIGTGEYFGKTVSTVGVDKKSLQFVYEFEENGKKVSKNVIINLTDTAGQERYFSITQSYFKGSSGVFLLYSITDQKSFRNLERWLTTVKKNIGNYENNKHLIFLLGTKLDLVEKDESLREVTEKEAIEFCEKNDLKWLGEHSSKDISKEELKEMLTNISKQLYETIGFNKIVRNTLSTLEKKKTKKRRKKCC